MLQNEGEHPVNQDQEFDFESHADAAVSAYLAAQDYYSKSSAVVASIIEECLKAKNIGVHSVQHRSKDPKSLKRKASHRSETNPSLPKYKDPLKEITDLSAVRIIAHFPATIVEIDRLIRGEFDVVEHSDKGAELRQGEKFGYQSVHYLVKMKAERSALAEYKRFSQSITEIQVRTILQHAWAEIEHDIQYKSKSAIPSEVRRRFMALAGMLEMADREFQAIQDTDRAINEKAQSDVKKGDLDEVEITANSLKAFLDKKIGPDGRIADFNYEWTAEMVRLLGFSTLKQVDEAISPFDDNKLSNIATGTRQGQTTRFEMMLLAALGQNFIDRHKWKNEPWFTDNQKKYLKSFTQEGVKTGSFSISP